MSEIIREFKEEARLEGIRLGESRGEKRGIQLGEERGIRLGESRGEERGIRLGESRGEKRGIQKGRQEGDHEVRLELAKNLMGVLSEKLIAEKTGLPLETVLAISKEIH